MWKRVELWPRLRLDHFVSSDKHLTEVARLEGISVVNPDDP
jgi:hypothetical protein